VSLVSDLQGEHDGCHHPASFDRPESEDKVPRSDKENCYLQAQIGRKYCAASWSMARHVGCVEGVKPIINGLAFCVFMH
jgi:hypothetical protein